MNNDTSIENVGVIVARFQVHKLTKGHQLLISEALSQCDRVLILLGESASRITSDNPLPFKTRKSMIRNDVVIRNHLHRLQIKPLHDHSSDSVWSAKLDNEVQRTFPDVNNVKIYSGRNGIRDYYHGHFPIKEMSFDIDHINATEVRSLIYKQARPSVKFREGIIYAAQHKYPISYQTVDIAIVDQKHESVLVCRKDGEDNYRFIGGFVDTTDNTLEDAAKREVKEECAVETTNYRYLGSFRIDDWRYRRSSDKIMTALFICDYVSGISSAQDDIAETRWLSFEMMEKTEFMPEHEKLKAKLIEAVKASK